MGKNILFFLIFCPLLIFSQKDIVEAVESDTTTDTETTEYYMYLSDSLAYNKSTAYENKRKFKVDLKDKYSGKDFQYKEEEQKKEEPKPVAAPNLSFAKAFAAFMKSIFPFLLGAIVVYIILKLYLGAPSSLWNSKASSKKIADKLIYEDDDIENTDLESLLQKALDQNQTRLAIRYYYLILLKKMSEKEIIKYDKDKTNSEYLFEIADTNTRKEYSYLSYIYNYVWYGEFELNESDFSTIQNRYKSFYKKLVS